MRKFFRKDFFIHPMETKFCYGCNRLLYIDEFGRNISRKDGRDNLCLSCRRKQYLRKNSTARRYFPEEITDEELLRECRRRGLIE